MPYSGTGSTWLKFNNSGGSVIGQGKIEWNQDPGTGAITVALFFSFTSSPWNAAAFSATMGPVPAIPAGPYKFANTWVSYGSQQTPRGAPLGALLCDGGKPSDLFWIERVTPTKFQLVVPSFICLKNQTTTPTIPQNEVGDLDYLIIPQM